MTDLLTLLKANIGITSTSRDEYLKSLLDAVSNELTNEKGLSLESLTAQMFVVDYTAWRFKHRGEDVMPRNLEYRLRNLIIKQVSADE